MLINVYNLLNYLIYLRKVIMNFYMFKSLGYTSPAINLLFGQGINVIRSSNKEYVPTLSITVDNIDMSNASYILDNRYRPYSSGIAAPGRNLIVGLRLNL